MLPFSIKFKSGVPVYEQVIYSVKKALATGQLRPGDEFPSVRTLSQELKINPNTAHKVVTVLLNDRILEVIPGIGTVVSQARRGTLQERSLLLEEEVEQLVVEARRLGLDLEQLEEALRRHWKRMSHK
jgi:GntR family transcriptional regulator